VCSGFENRELFTSTLEFATARGLVLWSSVVTMALAAKEEGAREDGWEGKGIVSTAQLHK
jgi:hypothetical protein